MKNNLLIFSLIIVASLITGCTLNLGTPESSSAPKTNTASNLSTASANTEKPKEPVSETAKPSASTEKKETESAKKVEPDSTTNDSSGDPKSEEEQIQFKRGETDVTLERTIAPGVSKVYGMNARKGQIMWFKVTEGTKQLGVNFNKNPVKIGTEVRHVLDVSGDWAIYVDNPTDSTLKYTLWVGIE